MVTPWGYNHSSIPLGLLFSRGKRLLITKKNPLILLVKNNSMKSPWKSQKITMKSLSESQKIPMIWVISPSSRLRSTTCATTTSTTSTGAGEELSWGLVHGDDNLQKKIDKVHCWVFSLDLEFIIEYYSRFMGTSARSLECVRFTIPLKVGMHPWCAVTIQIWCVHFVGWFPES